MALGIRDIIKTEIWCADSVYKELTWAMDMDDNYKYVMTQTRCDELIFYNTDTKEVRAYTYDIVL